MISVVIPTYNRKKVIMRAINSVLEQTYRDIELIVVDDCSDDGTVELLSTIQDRRFRVEKLQKRSGAPAARNQGVRVSKGEYIAFQDSDDVWMPTKLEQQLKFLTETEADMVGCNYNIQTDDGESTPLIDDLHQKNLVINTEDLIPKNFIGTPTLFGKREVFEHIPFREDMPRFQDWLLVLEVTRQYRVCFDNHAMVNAYIQRSDRISNSTEAYQKGMKRIVDWLCEEFKNHPQEMLKPIEKVFEHYAFLVSNFNDIKDLQEDNKNLRCTLDSIMNSKSWRITKPLRILMEKIKR